MRIECESLWFSWFEILFEITSKIFKNGILVVSISLQTCLGDNLDVTESCRNSMYWVLLQRSYGAAKGERSFPIEFTNDRYSDIESLIGNGTLMAQILGFLPYLHLFKTSSDSFWSSWCQKSAVKPLFLKLTRGHKDMSSLASSQLGPYLRFPLHGGGRCSSEGRDVSSSCLVSRKDVYLANFSGIPKRTLVKRLLSLFEWFQKLLMTQRLDS